MSIWMRGISKSLAENRPYGRWRLTMPVRTMPVMFAIFERLLHQARQKRWANLLVVTLRIGLAFAFVPAGLKKVIYQPFTDPQNTGLFHEFLHAFYATGAFYSFVGVLQLLAALLLLSQRFALVGALILLPIVSTILVFCWSTAVYPTATVVTFLFAATAGLVLWDLQKWRTVFLQDQRGGEIRMKPSPASVDLNLWTGCGILITSLYLLVCALTGGVYRPMGAEFDSPAFYVFPLMLLAIAATFVIDQIRWTENIRAHSRASGAAR